MITQNILETLVNANLWFATFFGKIEDQKNPNKYSLHGRLSVEQKNTSFVWKACCRSTNYNKPFTKVVDGNKLSKTKYRANWFFLLQKMQNVKMSKGGKIGRWVGGSQNLHPFHSLQILLQNVSLLQVPPETFKRTIKRK